VCVGYGWTFGHTDRGTAKTIMHNVYGERSRFISTSVCARLQVSVCSGYNLCHPG